MPWAGWAPQSHSCGPMGLRSWCRWPFYSRCPQAVLADSAPRVRERAQASCPTCKSLNDRPISSLLWDSEDMANRLIPAFQVKGMAPWIQWRVTRRSHLYFDTKAASIRIQLRCQAWLEIKPVPMPTMLKGQVLRPWWVRPKPYGSFQPSHSGPKPSLMPRHSCYSWVGENQLDWRPCQ